MNDGYTLALNTAIAALTPPERLTVSQWADRYRILPSKGASEAGQWRTDRTPYLREIMDALHPDHPARRIVFMKSVQVGATEAGLNWLGFFIAQCKAPMMVIQPSAEMTERFSKQRLAAMIDDCPQLRAMIRPARERDSGNTITLKEFPGGVIILAGANSPASLRSMPAKYIFMDEVDAYPGDLSGEGDPVSLAEARASTFPNRKIFLCSTPTVSSLSRIQREYDASDQRRYHVPCPHCHEYQVLNWEQLAWTPGEPEKAAYACLHCGALIEEHQKTAMLKAGQWRAEYPERPIVGFSINSLYTPTGLGPAWTELAALWETVQLDANAQRTFINLRLGQPTQSRAGNYLIRQIPPGCYFATAGVDVQKDRLAIVLLGFGRNNKVWVLDWVELFGNPLQPDAWKQLDAYLDQPLQHDTRTLRISAVAIDSGYLPDSVLAYTRARRGRVIATRGSAFKHRPLIAGKPTKVDFTAGGKTLKAGGEIWFIGSDTGKELLFARLAADRETAQADRCIHFAKDLDQSFYSQLSAEMFDPKKRLWIKIRPRNEALDCFIYAVAASMQPRHRVHLWKETQWAKIEKQATETPALWPAPRPGRPSTLPAQPSAQPEPPAQPPHVSVDPAPPKPAPPRATPRAPRFQMVR